MANFANVGIGPSPPIYGCPNIFHINLIKCSNSHQIPKRPQNLWPVISSHCEIARRSESWSIDFSVFDLSVKKLVGAYLVTFWQITKTDGKQTRRIDQDSFSFYGVIFPRNKRFLQKLFYFKSDPNSRNIWRGKCHTMDLIPNLDSQRIYFQLTYYVNIWLYKFSFLCNRLI